MLIHQLPATPSNLRVRTWRRLQELGAVALKQSVYVLPDSPEAREDFEWLRVEIEGSGGQASVFVSDSIGAGGDAELIAEFRKSRQAAYAALAADLQRQQKTRPRSGDTRDQVNRLRQRLTAIEKIDYFGADGRERVLGLLASLEPARSDDAARSTGKKDGEYRNRIWVTRPLPGVDRMGSAWLIRRFIDPSATFAFAPDPQSAPKDAVTFDMFGGEFTHRGRQCTFETLCAQFAITDPAVARLAEVVHDIDMKDGEFGAAEAPTVAATIEGLQLSCGDDQALLEQGIALFEALYRSFAQHAPKPRAKRTARRRPTASRRK
jgi:hypothetical protein